MNRREKREKIQEINLVSDVVKIMKKYFPDLLTKFNKMSDKRNQSYTKYDMSTIALVRLLGLICGYKSMRELTFGFNNENVIKNIGNILGTELTEIPHGDTINDVFVNTNFEEMQEINKYMINRLIRSKMFEKYRYKNKYYQVVVDGTGLKCHNTKPNEHAVRKVHNKGTEDEYTQYFHYVLEAKLVVGNMVFSIATEFVENEDEDVEKQDCEIKAFVRLAEKLKKMFPKLPIIISGDALYACDTLYDICKKYNWEYICRFKTGRIKSLGEEIDMLEKIENEKEKKTLMLWNNVTYGKAKENKTINVIKLYEKDNKKDQTIEYVWVTSFEIKNGNIKDLIYLGKQRWRIENEGFNIQKNETFNIEHECSRNYNAIKIHYLFIQIAHLIRQLLECGVKIVKELKLIKKEVTKTLKIGITSIIKTLTEAQGFQLRFDEHIV